MTIIEQQPLRTRASGWHAISSLGLAFSYIAALAWTYSSTITQTWSRLGFTYAKPDPAVFVFAVLAAGLPALLLPRTAERVGDFILWVVYYALYVPAVVIPALMGNLAIDTLVAMISALLVAFLIMCIPRSKKIPKMERAVPLLNSQTFWFVFFVLYAGLNLWMVIAYGSKLRFVSFADVYSQRDVASDVQQASLVGYATGIVAGAFNPFLMAVGLTRKRYGLFFLGFLGEGFVFATAAMKAVLLCNLLLPVFFLLVFRKGPYNLTRVGIGFAGTAVLLAFIGAGIYDERESVLQILFTLVYMRTFCMVGVLMSIYTEFFQTHPLTYFSHIGPLRMYIDYPFSDALGNIIGNYMIPADVPMDANAGFFATDGVAALGIPGIVLSGIFFRFFIAFFDVCVSERVLALACCSIILVLINVTNVSMFTTLLSSGGAMLAVILYFYGQAELVPGPISARPAKRLRA